ncbi:STAS domain-containing protein [Clostridium magnum]|uniref:Anti-sigma F factor antagonist n=1 Tax=Clostridium magnum DSM 2767 TaxID=1121326 RepID=A0A162T7U5_9CLOT|nr:STAS domain-containing protein [Clostridium magnum]KZL92337.1 anti-sigma F factor antagonist [Clostridium magnum DSM 2767]SHH12937.1 anti-sigma B factor antagonist [Clostridium magnum DSM 2767]
MWKIEEVCNVKIIYLDKEFYLDSNEVFEALIKETLEEKNKIVILSLKNIEFINSTMLGEILRFYKELIHSKGELVISSLSEDIRNLLEVTRINKIIKIFESEVEAIEYFKSLDIDYNNIKRDKK